LDKTSTWLFVIGCRPYAHELPSDPAIDITMAAGAFGQSASVLFIGDGCQYLNQGVLPPADQADLRKLLKSLPFYDVDKLFVGSAEPIANIDLDELQVTHLQPSDITSLVSSAAHVVTFT
jgi:sulfur relay (sulfurtransferase) DsrF/TusC family protein